MSIELWNGHDWVRIDTGLYPDNTPVIDYDQSNWLLDFDAMLLRPKTMQEFFTGMMLCSAISERGGRVENLILPYVPGARQDRLKNEGDMLFTIKYVADTINAQGFDHVVILDAHSLVTPALIDRCINVSSYRYATQNLFGGKYDSIIAPDAGATKRAEKFAARLKVPVVQAFKHRDPITNKLSDFSIPDAQLGWHYLIVDDICDAGGTFLGLAEKIHEAGATADLFVTHGLFSKGTQRLAEAFGKVYTTDSIDFHHERVVRIDASRGLISYV